MSSQTIFDEVTAGLIFDLNAGDAIPAADLDPNGAYPVYGSNGIRGNTSKYNQFEDIILIGRQGSVGTVHLAKAPCWVAEHALRVYPKRKLNKKWLAYALDAQNLEELSVGTAQPGISAAAVLRQKFPLPPSETQRRITEYLDRETRQIDETITRIDWVVELLEERITAVIGAAVRDTDGLYPKATVQTIGSISSGISIPTEQIKEEGEFPVYGGNGVRGFNNKFTESEDRVLIGRQGALCGNIQLAKAPFWASEHALMIRPHNEIDLRWLAYTLLDQRLGQLSMAAAQPGITASAIGRQKIPFPPLIEQATIADSLDSEISTIHMMISKASRVRKLLVERRSALITAAVTGRIEV